MTIATFILLVAFILFAIPAIRALFAGSIDFTNSGLALATAAFVFPAIF